MKLPGKGALLAILLTFSPGIAFALFELFVTDLPVKPRAKLFGWASLVVGFACVVALLAITVKDFIRRRKDHLRLQ